MTNFGVDAVPDGIFWLSVVRNGLISAAVLPGECHVAGEFGNLEEIRMCGNLASGVS